MTEELKQEQAEQEAAEEVVEETTEATEAEEKEETTAEEAAAEFEKSEKGLRYQLIEGKLMKDNDIKLDYKELVDYAKVFIRQQMAQFGNMNPEEKELDDIAKRILSNQEEARRISEQLISQKLLALYKEKANIKVKEITYENFVKEVYGDK
jgi:trigger factor